MTMTNGTIPRPVHQIRYGSVEAAVWENQTHSNNNSDGVSYFYCTTFRRIYKSNDVWAEASSFDDRSLLNLAKAAQDAHSWIFQRKAEAERPRESNAVENLN